MSDGRNCLRDRSCNCNKPMAKQNTAIVTVDHTDSVDSNYCRDFRSNYYLAETIPKACKQCVAYTTPLASGERLYSGEKIHAMICFGHPRGFWG